jgi:prophage antirepressor-like protein
MSCNNLTPFAFDDALVRVRTDEAGNPWFVAKDVCRVLELGNVTEATRNLDDDERAEFSITEIRSDGIEQGRVYVTVSESGLYSLVFRSRKPQAKLFRKWVTSEVLPAVRKTGGYALPGRADLPEAAMRLRPSMREKVLDSAMQAARLIGVSSREEIDALFLHYCALVGAMPSGVGEEVRAFYAECCIHAPGRREKVADLYAAFRRWHAGRGGFTPSMKSFSQSLAQFARRVKSNHMAFQDVALLRQS